MHLMLLHITHLVLKPMRAQSMVCLKVLHVSSNELSSLYGVTACPNLEVSHSRTFSSSLIRRTIAVRMWYTHTKKSVVMYMSIPCVAGIGRG